jgi:predicted nuclease of predicted toxin-antitoxin system
MLLLDENISYRIAKDLSSSFSGIKHIKDFLDYGSSDDAVWEVALKNNLTIVSFDADYEDILTLHGFPPKIIWFRFGNSSNQIIVKTLLFYQPVIIDFINNDSLGILEIKEAIN